jgi:acetyl-CoA carboxylase biotin carboxyl carrier protein
MDGNRHSSNSVEALSQEEPQAAESISIEQLRHLVRLLDQSDVSEIEIRQIEAGMRLVLRKAKATESVALQLAEASSVNGDMPPPPSETKHTVVAPLVGIFHSWAKPRGRSLVAVGDRVKVGQPVGTIQSLNVINEVESTVAGRVVEILVQDGQPVEYGQPLVVIESAEG